MNERIQEFAEQARDYADDTYKNFSNNSGWFELYNEKFAELIVRECAKKGFDIFDEEPDAPASDLQFYVRDRIKEHFGVES